MTLYTQFQLRRDTTSNWSSANPVLAEGELGFDTTLAKIKIGDGITAWNSLDFIDNPTYEITSGDISYIQLGSNQGANSSSQTFADIVGAWSKPSIFAHRFFLGGYLRSISLRVETALDANTTIDFNFWDSTPDGKPNNLLLDTPLQFDSTSLTTTGNKTLTIPTDSDLYNRFFRTDEYLFIGINYVYSSTTGAMRAYNDRAQNFELLYQPSRDFFNRSFAYAFFSDSEMFVNTPLTGKNYTSSTSTSSGEFTTYTPYLLPIFNAEISR